MKKFTTAFAGILFLMAGSLAYSHGNHEEEAPVTRQLAGGRAIGIVGSLVEDKKLSPS